MVESPNLLATYTTDSTPLIACGQHLMPGCRIQGYQCCDIQNISTDESRLMMQVILFENQNIIWVNEG